VPRCSRCQAASPGNHSRTCPPQALAATPVWVVGDSGRLYVWTGAQTGKADRIRHDPAVTVAPCTARGTPTGSAVPAQAKVVLSASQPRVWPQFLAKYGIQLRAVLWSARITGLPRHGRAQSGRVFLELTLTDS
jgi:PPOX class probable F420-dependent enzyme